MNLGKSKTNRVRAWLCLQTLEIIAVLYFNVFKAVVRIPLHLNQL